MERQRDSDHSFPAKNRALVVSSAEKSYDRGCAKRRRDGAPEHATMLCFITTDCAITKSLLRRPCATQRMTHSIRMAIEMNEHQRHGAVSGATAKPEILRSRRSERLLDVRETLEEVMRYIAHEMGDGR